MTHSVTHLLFGRVSRQRGATASQRACAPVVLENALDAPAAAIFHACARGARFRQRFAPQAARACASHTALTPTHGADAPKVGQAAGRLGVARRRVAQRRRQRARRRRRRFRGCRRRRQQRRRRRRRCAVGHGARQALSDAAERRAARRAVERHAVQHGRSVDAALARHAGAVQHAVLCAARRSAHATPSVGTRDTTARPPTGRPTTCARSASGLASMSAASALCSCAPQRSARGGRRRAGGRAASTARPAPTDATSADCRRATCRPTPTTGRRTPASKRCSSPQTRPNRASSSSTMADRLQENRSNKQMSRACERACVRFFYMTRSNPVQTVPRIARCETTAAQMSRPSRSKQRLRSLRSAL